MPRAVALAKLAAMLRSATTLPRRSCLARRRTRPACAQALIGSGLEHGVTTNHVYWVHEEEQGTQDQRVAQAVRDHLQVACVRACVPCFELLDHACS